MERLKARELQVGDCQTFDINQKKGKPDRFTGRVERIINTSQVGNPSLIVIIPTTKERKIIGGGTLIFRQ